MPKAKQRLGFTLVELSIVLVILGLLVGGVLTGQSLIRAAELRSITSDFQKYQTAVYTFRDKYFDYPGKMQNATSYWGKNNTACPSATGSAATPGTCNSTSATSSFSAMYFYENEMLLFWQHLALAGLVEGNYAGMATYPEGYTIFAGRYVPASKISGAYFTFPFSDGGASVVMMPSDSSNHIHHNTLTFGTLGTDTAAGMGDCRGCGGVLLHEEAYNIDKKADDGVANQGKIMSNTIDTQSGAEFPGTCPSYDLSNKTGRCAISYQMFE